MSEHHAEWARYEVLVSASIDYRISYFGEGTERAHWTSLHGIVQSPADRGGASDARRHSCVSFYQILPRVLCCAHCP
jgi:hypothetical protein